MERVFNLGVLSLDALFSLRLFLNPTCHLGQRTVLLPRIKLVDVKSGVHQRNNGYEVVNLRLVHLRRVRDRGKNLALILHYCADSTA